MGGLGHRASVVVVLVLALLIPATLGVAALGFEAQQTRPNRIHVEAPCRPGAWPDFSGVVAGDALWRWCGRDGAWVRFDPARARARRFAAPVDAALRRPVGLLPHADGRLAAVHRTREGGLSVQVLGPDGDVLPPIRLPLQSGDELLGLAWSDAELEIAWGPVGTSPMTGARAPTIAVVDDETIRVRRTWGAMSDLCGTDEPCALVPLAYVDAGRWHFAVRSPRGDVFDLDEDGRRRGSALAACPRCIHGVDRAHSGVVDRAHTLQAQWRRGAGIPTLTRAGEIVSASLAGRHDWKRAARGDVLVLESGTLRRRAAWSEHSMRAILARDGVGWLGLERNPSGTIASFNLAPDGRRERTTTVAAPDATCDFASAIAVPRERGGHFVVGQNGCYLALDEDAGRTDPPPLGEHFDREQIVALWWIAAGLPLCLAFGFGVAGRRRRVATLASAFYVATGGAALLELLPLL